MAWSSAVPVAMTALVAAFRASPALAAPVDVRDGPVVTAATARDVVIVGWTGRDGDERAVEATPSTEGSGSRDREPFSIRCAAMSVNASGDAVAAVVAARARAYELHAACGAAVAGNRRLGGAVMYASMGEHSLDQAADQNGLLAVVEFLVDCDAFTTR